MAVRFRRLLVPIDFSANTDRALRLAADLGGAGGRLILLHVTPEFRNEPAQHRALEDANERLHALARRLARRKDAPKVEIRVEPGDPYRRIAAAAADADAIVMCTLGRTGLPHLVIGSVAEKVVRHAPVPVLTFRPGH